MTLGSDIRPCCEASGWKAVRFDQGYTLIELSHNHCACDRAESCVWAWCMQDLVPLTFAARDLLTYIVPIPVPDNAHQQTQSFRTCNMQQRQMWLFWRPSYAGLVCAPEFRHCHGACGWPAHYSARGSAACAAGSPADVPTSGATVPAHIQVRHPFARVHGGDQATQSAMQQACSGAYSSPGCPRQPGRGK